MATQTLKMIRPWKLDRAAMVVRGGLDDPSFIEAASQTWKIGSLVYWAAATGHVAICTNASQALDSQILGRALTAGRNLTTGAAATDPKTGNFQVQIIKASQEYIGNIYHTTAASAVGVQADVGDVKGLYYVAATGLWHIDYVNAVEGAADSLARVIITGWPSVVDGVPNAITDIYAFVRFKFITVSIASDSVPTNRTLQDPF
jgi:hypothetical protein